MSATATPASWWSTATGKVQKQHFKDAGVTDRTWDRDEAGYTIPR